MLAALLDGQLVQPDRPALCLDERGFHYGDGVFETMLLQHGRVRFIEDHWQRLQLGCERLQIPMPARTVLLAELAQLTAYHDTAVIKLVISRGRSERGYRPPPLVHPTRLWQLFAAPVLPATSGIQVRWCTTRLSRNATLAGIKHCNRLEQVLAQAEWSDSTIGEGLMLDTEGELVAATMSNVFLVLGDVLVTPDLRYCGIHGVLRKNLLQFAMQHCIEVEQRAVRAEDVYAAQEIFLSNSVRGIQAVTQLEQRCWAVGPVTQRLQNALELSL
ncbi:MAG: aminodeoxychorismate lyase [Steroidobacteraceae bacterium]